MKLFAIRDRNLKLDGGAMFGVVPKVLWQKIYPSDENNLCNWAMRCLLVDTGDRKFLIDNGAGDKQGENFFRHYYMNGEFTLESSLKAAGYDFSDITDVILTHLHFDHCGGSVKYNQDKTMLEVTFPNATYWIGKRHWETATNPNHRERASFLKENIIPIQESRKMNLIESEGEIYPGITIKIFDGHTDGQVIPHISYQGRTVVFMGDLIPSSAHIIMSYNMGYDVRPLITLKEKDQFYQEALKNHYILFFEHDLYQECCTLLDTPKGVRIKECFTLKEFFGE